MAVGGSEYSVLLKAVIQKLTQAEIDAQTKGLKINLDVNLVGAGAVAEQIDKIKKSTSAGGVFAGKILLMQQIRWLLCPQKSRKYEAILRGLVKT